VLENAFIAGKKCVTRILGCDKQVLGIDNV